ncbi:STAS domain-containing protein [Streptomyces misionensis]|uniref:STAS domain-containing protein n=1 Tax=Streptomyces misionensis TaxID=67331 RepID=A0A5C6IRE1_9ACTN|nr:STAS domain-containing protein [Streptomyces misionensis]TWV31516.1 STAS domain-containing protein [Streptomyces misionensis]
MQDLVRHASLLLAPGGRRGSREGERAPLPPGLATASYTADGAWTRVEIAGELDLDSGDRLRGGLLAALARSDRGLALDLDGLGFCDCAGLAVLMDLRQRAVREGKTVVVRAAGPAVGRLLSLIGAEDLFAPPTPRT